MKQLHEEALWNAVMTRDRSYDGVFFYGVKTTGVFCRPGCPSPLPKRENTVFAFSPSALLQQGFRPCRRCWPDATSRPTGTVATVVNLCRFVDESEGMFTAADLAARSGLSTSAVTRLFREALGVTPREYADARRRERFRGALRNGADVLEATYDAGFGSTSRVYEYADAHLGMTPKAYRNAGRGQRIAYTVEITPLGHLLVAATEKGICSVKLGDARDVLIEEFHREFASADLEEGGEFLAGWTRQLLDYLSGHLPWPELPYDVRATAFQRQVWEHLRRIPSGTVEHYSEVARRLGRPRATRAVARACATNPVAVVVPCHRVVPKGRELAGYRWGVDRKRALLQLEGAVVSDT